MAVSNYHLLPRTVDSENITNTKDSEPDLLKLGKGTYWKGGCDREKYSQSRNTWNECVFPSICNLLKNQMSHKHKQIWEKKSRKEKKSGLSQLDNFVID